MRDIDLKKATTNPKKPVYDDDFDHDDFYYNNWEFINKINNSPEDLFGTDDKTITPIKAAGWEDYGESKYDMPNVMNAGSVEDSVNENRAAQQGFVEKIGLGFAKMAGTTGITFLGNTVGTIWGLGSAIYNGDASKLYDNDFTNTMQDLTESMEKAMPHYSSKYEGWGSDFWGNFIGKDIIQNLGFAAGTGLSLILPTGALNGVKALGMGLKATKAAKLAYNTKVGQVAAKVLNSNFVRGGSKALAETAIAAYSAHGESTIEALQNKRDYLKLQNQMLADDINQKKQELDAQWAQIVQDKYNGDIKLAMTAGHEYRDYLKAQIELAQYRDRKQHFINSEADKVANLTYIGNLAITGGTNFLTFGKAMMGGFKVNKRIGAGVRQVITDEAGKTKDIGKRAATKLLSEGKTFTAEAKTSSPVLQFWKKAFFEGVQEMNQEVVAEGTVGIAEQDMMNWESLKDNPNAEKIVLSNMNLTWDNLGDWLINKYQKVKNNTGEYLNAAGKVYSDPSQYRQFFGGMFGAAIHPHFSKGRDGKTHFHFNTMYQDREQANYENNTNQLVADYINNNINSESGRNYIQGLVRHQALDEIKQRSATADSKMDFEDADFAQFVNDVVMLERAGKLGFLRAHLNKLRNLNDEELEDYCTNIFVETKDGKKVGDFIDDNGNYIGTSDQARKEIRDKINARVDKLNKDIDYYQKSMRDIESRTQGEMSSELLSQFVWEQCNIANKYNRAYSLLGKDNVLKNVNDYNIAFSNLLTERTNEKELFEKGIKAEQERIKKSPTPQEASELLKEQQAKVEELTKDIALIREVSELLQKGFGAFQATTDKHEEDRKAVRNFFETYKDFSKKMPEFFALVERSVKHQREEAKAKENKENKDSKEKKEEKPKTDKEKEEEEKVEFGINDLLLNFDKIMSELSEFKASDDVTKELTDAAILHSRARQAEASYDDLLKNPYRYMDGRASLEKQILENENKEDLKEIEKRIKKLLDDNKLTADNLDEETKKIVEEYQKEKENATQDNSKKGKFRNFLGKILTNARTIPYEELRRRAIQKLSLNENFKKIREQQQMNLFVGLAIQTGTNDEDVKKVANKTFRKIRQGKSVSETLAYRLSLDDFDVKDYLIEDDNEEAKNARLQKLKYASPEEKGTLPYDLNTYIYVEASVRNANIIEAEAAKLLQDALARYKQIYKTPKVKESKQDKKTNEAKIMDNTALRKGVLGNYKKRIDKFISNYKKGEIFSVADVSSLHLDVLSIIDELDKQDTLTAEEIKDLKNELSNGIENLIYKENDKRIKEIHEKELEEKKKELEKLKNATQELSKRQQERKEKLEKEQKFEENKEKINTEIEKFKQEVEAYNGENVFNKAFAKLAVEDKESIELNGSKEGYFIYNGKVTKAEIAPCEVLKDENSQEENLYIVVHKAFVGYSVRIINADGQVIGHKTIDDLKDITNADGSYSIIGYNKKKPSKTSLNTFRTMAGLSELPTTENKDKLHEKKIETVNEIVEKNGVVDENGEVDLSNVAETVATANVILDDKLTPQTKDVDNVKDSVEVTDKEDVAETTEEVDTEENTTETTAETTSEATETKTEDTQQSEKKEQPKNKKEKKQTKEKKPKQKKEKPKLTPKQVERIEAQISKLESMLADLQKQAEENVLSFEKERLLKSIETYKNYVTFVKDNYSDLGGVTKVFLDDATVEKVIKELCEHLNKILDGNVEVLSNEEIEKKAEELGGENVEFQKRNFDYDTFNNITNALLEDIANAVESNKWDSDSNHALIRILYDIENGKRIYKRLPKGTIRKGDKTTEILGAASIILRGKETTSRKEFNAVQRTIGEKYTARREDAERQEEIIETWAKQWGLWFETIESATEDFVHDEKLDGSESLGYRNDGANIRKLLSTDHAITIQKTLDRIALHNKFFPTTPIKIIGFTRDKDKQFRLVVEQPHIQGRTLKSDEQYKIVDYMKKLGFEPTDATEQRFTNKDKSIYIGDLHPSNVMSVIDENGEEILFFVDSDIFYRTQDLEKRRAGNYQINENIVPNSNENIAGVPTADEQFETREYDYQEWLEKQYALGDWKDQWEEHEEKQRKVEPSKDEQDVLDNFDLEPFFSKDKGNIYGFTSNSKIYLNRDKIRIDTPVHEYTHLWDKALQRVNPELWQRGIELMQQTDEWQKVLQDEAYANSNGMKGELNVNAVASEVHARLSGMIAAGKVIEKAAADTTKNKRNFWQKVVDWFNDVKTFLLKDVFGMKTEDIQKVSLKDFLNAPIADFFNGTNPNNIGNNTYEVKDNNPKKPLPPTQGNESQEDRNKQAEKERREQLAKYGITEEETTSESTSEPTENNTDNTTGEDVDNAEEVPTNEPKQTNRYGEILDEERYLNDATYRVSLTKNLQHKEDILDASCDEESIVSIAIKHPTQPKMQYVIYWDKKLKKWSIQAQLRKGYKFSDLTKEETNIFEGITYLPIEVRNKIIERYIPKELTELALTMMDKYSKATEENKKNARNHILGEDAREIVITEFEDELVKKFGIYTSNSDMSYWNGRNTPDGRRPKEVEKRIWEEQKKAAELAKSHANEGGDVETSDTTTEEQSQLEPIVTSIEETTDKLEKENPKQVEVVNVENADTVIEQDNESNESGVVADTFKGAITEFDLANREKRTIETLGDNYKYAYNLHLALGAFDYVKQGNLHEGDTVYIGYGKSGEIVNSDGTTTNFNDVLFFVKDKDGNYQLIGIIGHGKNDPQTARQLNEQVSLLADKGNESRKENFETITVKTKQATGDFTSGQELEFALLKNNGSLVTTTVSKILNGSLMYSKEQRSLKDVVLPNGNTIEKELTDNKKFKVIMGFKDLADMHTNFYSEDELDFIIKNGNSIKTGHIFIAVKNANNQYQIIPVRLKTYGELLADNNNEVAKEITNLLSDLYDNGTTGKSVDTLTKQLNKLLYNKGFKVFFNKGGSIGVRLNGESLKVPTTKNEFIAKMQDLLSRCMININSDTLNNKKTLNKYINSDVFTTNLKSTEYNNAFFTLKPIDAAGNQLEANTDIDNHTLAENKIKNVLGFLPIITSDGTKQYAVVKTANDKYAVLTKDPNSNIFNRTKDFTQIQEMNIISYMKVKKGLNTDGKNYIYTNCKMNNEEGTFEILVYVSPRGNKHYYRTDNFLEVDVKNIVLTKESKTIGKEVTDVKDKEKQTEQQAKEKTPIDKALDDFKGLLTEFWKTEDLTVTESMLDKLRVVVNMAEGKNPATFARLINSRDYGFSKNEKEMYTRIFFEYSPKVIKDAIDYLSEANEFDVTPKAGWFEEILKRNRLTNKKLIFSTIAERNTDCD